MVMSVALLAASTGNASFPYSIPSLFIVETSRLWEALGSELRVGPFTSLWVFFGCTAQPAGS